MPFVGIHKIYWYFLWYLVFLSKDHRKKYQQIIMPLADTKICNLKPLAKTKPYSDSSGLYLQVTNKGSNGISLFGQTENVGTKLSCIDCL